MLKILKRGRPWEGYSATFPALFHKDELWGETDGYCYPDKMGFYHATIFNSAFFEDCLIIYTRILISHQQKRKVLC